MNVDRPRENVFQFKEISFSELKEYFGVPSNDTDFPISTPKPIPGQMMKKAPEVPHFTGNLAEMCIPEFLAELTTGCKYFKLY
jgi:hypothetical protein